MDEAELEALVTTMDSRALGTSQYSPRHAYSWYKDAICIATVVALSLALYDHGLTLYDEVIFVWRKPMHSGSLLFLWIRYYGLAELVFRSLAILANTPGSFGIRLPISHPVFLLRPSEGLSFVVVFSTQVVLQIRVHVMYRNPYLTKFNFVFFVAEIISILAMWASAGGSDVNLSSPVDSLSAYFKLKDRKYPFIPFVLFQAWIGLLGFAKFIQRLRKLRVGHVGAPHGEMDLVGVLMRDR
ncbi:hypothetical protein EXIGLDRAFT_769614 [Exidia glandulosa HHB12029]|uniref:DUF6533 domain-containing protein n=1 Tax=Exidia glandulosa HHB12029 TaxID=1314781 RepID=A0A165HCH0_EXIGL|nr:hypothetical protein EXIGLDRAFT_769614 [Exidia glandulosa HHB12029]